MNAQIEQNQQVAVFNFEQTQLRVEVDENGNPWFCAKDICDILGYANSRDAITKHCREAGVTKNYISSDSGKKLAAFIDEGNLNRLIIRSHMPEAERLSDLVCDEILPSIRKTGQY